MIKPLKIGNLLITFPVILAPMAGYTDSAMRSLCGLFNCGLTFTEVVNAAAVVHGSRRTLHLLETCFDTVPVAAHLYGSDPSVVAEAVSIVAALDRFCMIDINCGCPVRRIVAKGAGAALMQTPERIYDMVKAAGSATKLPVTVKTRIGWQPETMNIMEIAQAVTEAGGAAISIHARFATAKHSGPSNWDILAQVKNAVEIPVIGNGGISSASDATAMFSRTGVNAVMIGRAAIGNPWIFAEIEARLSCHDYMEHSDKEHAEIVRNHLTKLTHLKTIEYSLRRKRVLPPETSAVLHFRGHLAKYLAGKPGWSLVRKNLHSINTPERVMNAVATALSDLTPFSN
ncbi:MAG: tRNA-dihydrouridine synthase [Lentisphaerae bacterium]|nr:tRNA-dihydrouridine synthase [Lentisphaerota bacterium]